MLFGIFRFKEGNYIARITVSNDIDEYLKKTFSSPNARDFSRMGKKNMR